MKVTILTASNQKTGRGHYVRMCALCAELVKQGHKVLFISDKSCSSATVNYRWDSYPDLASPLRQVELNIPDWLIVDLPGETPKQVYDYRWQTCIIDGVGHPPSNGNINISQGLVGQYSAPEYLIIRPELFTALSLPRQKKHVFVFGGSSDKLELRRYWARHCNDYGEFVCPAGYSPEMLGQAMRNSEFAVVAMGMIVWELVALGIPAYVFSQTNRHLESALAMAKLGYVKAWPVVGLPEPEQFYDFVATPHKPLPEVVDGQGASRIVQLLTAAASPD